MREKLRERVLFVTNDEIKTLIPNEILPDYLGGTLQLNHKNWLNDCNNLVRNEISTCSHYYYEDENEAKSENNVCEITKDLNYSMSENLQENSRKRPLDDQSQIENKKQIIEKENTTEPLSFEEQ